jgi:hypothetical protein
MGEDIGRSEVVFVKVDNNIMEFWSQQSTWQCLHLWSCHERKKLITIVQNSMLLGRDYASTSLAPTSYIILEVPAHFAPVKPIHSAQGLTFPTGLSFAPSPDVCFEKAGCLLNMLLYV